MNCKHVVYALLQWCTPYCTTSRRPQSLAHSGSFPFSWSPLQNRKKEILVLEPSVTQDNFRPFIASLLFFLLSVSLSLSLSFSLSLAWSCEHFCRDCYILQPSFSRQSLMVLSPKRRPNPGQKSKRELLPSLMCTWRRFKRKEHLRASHKYKLSWYELHFLWDLKCSRVFVPWMENPKKLWDNRDMFYLKAQRLINTQIVGKLPLFTIIFYPSEATHKDS